MYEKDVPTKLRRYDLLSFSVCTEAKKLQQLLEGRLIKETKTLLRPPDEKHQVFFIDDLHMARTDKWKVQGANELFRQYLDYQGWYNLEKIYFKKVRDVNFVTTLSTRHQSKELVSERVCWHLGAIGVINFEGCHVEQIYHFILAKAFMNVNSNVVLTQAPAMLLKASLEFFSKYNESLKPSPTMFLFKLNTRHMLMLLKAFLDAPVSYFQMIEHVAFLWVSEVCRTVIDRHADAAEQDRLYETAKRIAMEAFSVRPKIFPREHHLPQFFYGQPESEHTYNEVLEERKLASLLNDTLEAYNKAHYSEQISVIIFNTLIEKTLKINRALLMPMANTILVADQGSGAYELVKIAIQLARANGMQLFQSDSEQSEDWRASLRSIVAKVGLEARSVCVLHLIENHFVEDVMQTLDAIAAHGELFQIFSPEEFESVLNQVRYKTFHSNVRGKERTEAQLIEEVREHLHLHLHLLLQLGPRSKTLLSKLREAPHLLDSSTLIYFGEWSDYGY